MLKESCPDLQGRRHLFGRNSLYLPSAEVLTSKWRLCGVGVEAVRGNSDVSQSQQKYQLNISGDLCNPENYQH